MLLAAWWGVMLLSTAGTVAFWRRTRHKPPGIAIDGLTTDGAGVGGVAVLVPIKGQAGCEPSVRALVAGCLAQLGAGGRLVVAVEGADDPAAAAVGPDPRVTLVVAGRSVGRGQKVHNLLAALGTLRAEDAFVVFADADLVPAADWLAQLLRPVVLGRVPLASGYRWILPADSHPASRMAALMDWGIATSARSRRWNLCWGGSTAISRAALDQVDLPHRWAGALLDDLVLTRAARHAGLAIHAPHHVLMVSPVRHDWRSLVVFGRRQYLLVRVHAPRHWWVAGAALVLPVLGFAAAAVAGWAGAGTVAAALVLQQVRASLRVSVAARVLEAEAAGRSAALMRRDRWLLPAAHLVHLGLWLASGVGRVTVWAGIRYRLLAPDRVEVLGRS